MSSTAEVTTRKLSAEETAALDGEVGKPKSPRPKNEKEKAAATKREAKAAEAKPERETLAKAKPEPKPKNPKPTPEEAKFALLEKANAVAKATRLKDASAVVTSESGKGGAHPVRGPHPGVHAAAERRQAAHPRPVLVAEEGRPRDGRDGRRGRRARQDVERRRRRSRRS
jgi:hypothetical protein